jgi:prenyltransferase beta subunit
VSYVRASQSRSGGFPWARGTAPDSNVTAWAVQALRATGVAGKPIARAIAYLRVLQAPSGGFRLVAGRAPDAQSTALAIQAFVAAGIKPPSGAFAFLATLRRADGSYRYSRAYATTPVWVTAQVLPALVKKPLPLR